MQECEGNTGLTRGPKSSGDSVYGGPKTGIRYMVAQEELCQAVAVAAAKAHPVLQQLQLGDELLREDVDTGAELLADLDEGGPEADEALAEPPREFRLLRADVIRGHAALHLLVRPGLAEAPVAEGERERKGIDLQRALQ